MTYKIKGSMAAPAVKILPIINAKINKEKDFVYLEGYANTKNKADRYGDVPCVYSAKRNYVYDVSEFKKNPVLLVDHVNRIDHLAGSVVEIKEDETGLKFKALFSTSALPLIAHARHVYSEGHAKGISIAGRFHYEDNNDPSKLTLAEIYEISLVAVPADPSGLAEAAPAVNAEESAKPEQVDVNLLKEEIAGWLGSLQ